MSQSDALKTIDVDLSRLRIHGARVEIAEDRGGDRVVIDVELRVEDVESGRTECIRNQQRMHQIARFGA